jgi:HEPN domain-containing protein
MRPRDGWKPRRKTWRRKIQDDAAALDRFYIPTRHPNGLPDLTPGKYYFLKDAEFGISIAESIMTLVRSTVAAID